MLHHRKQPKGFLRFQHCHNNPRELNSFLMSTKIVRVTLFLYFMFVGVLGSLDPIHLALADGDRLPTGVIPLNGVDETLPDDDLDRFDRAVGKSKIVALGEPDHTSEGVYSA